MSSRCCKFAIIKLLIANRIMDIVSRLKLFLKENGIGNAQFADTCSIPRPTVSQLLNGRNKKVSDEIISKIHAGYPKLNVMWLMFGDGNMFVPNANTHSTTQMGAPVVDDAANGAQQALRENANPQQAQISFSDPDDDNPYPVQHAQIAAQKQHHAAGNSSLSAAIANLAQAASMGSNVVPSSDPGSRRIVNIMVFYDDNSFESFTPRGK